MHQQYIGCYRDGEHGNRVMGKTSTNELMTIDWCHEFCQRSAYTYFGLEVRLLLSHKSQRYAKYNYYSHGANINVFTSRAYRVIIKSTAHPVIFVDISAMQTRSSDCPSVRVSTACIVTKRKKDLPRFLYLTTDHLA